MNHVDVYTYGEGRTGIGQAVEFTCHPDAKAEVTAFLREKVRTINSPATGRVNVTHGGYGRDTRYQVSQHAYAGGGGPGCGGYIEVLTIQDAPDDRWAIVLHVHRGAASCFSEWATLEDAKQAFTQLCGRGQTDEASHQPLAGFRRFVVCGLLPPWFYAIGDETLVGDYAFPDGLQDDPAFRFGRRFVVTDDCGVVSIKACMGTR